MRIHILQHMVFETPGIIADWAKQKGHKLSYTFLFDHTVKFPVAGEFDFLIVMGGAMGVYEEHKYSWLAPEKEFIKESIAAGKIVLGICLGAQLLAEALGAKVYATGINEIGFYPVHKTGAGELDDLIQHIPDSWTVFHWHGDTFDLPVGAIHLLSSTACKHQAFRLGKCIGLQFHPEVDAQLLQDMVHHEKHELIEADFVQTAEDILSTQVSLVNKKYLFDLLNILVNLYR